MSDPNGVGKLMGDLRTEWLRLFEAIDVARADRRLHVSEATITWEVLKESVSLREGDALDERKIQALKEACARMVEELRKGRGQK